MNVGGFGLGHAGVDNIEERTAGDSRDGWTTVRWIEACPTNTPQFQLCYNQYPTDTVLYGKNLALRARLCI